MYLTYWDHMPLWILNLGSCLFRSWHKQRRASKCKILLYWMTCIKCVGVLGRQEHWRDEDLYKFPSVNGGGDGAVGRSLLIFDLVQFLLMTNFSVSTSIGSCVSKESDDTLHSFSSILKKLVKRKKNLNLIIKQIPPPTGILNAIFRLQGNSYLVKNLHHIEWLWIWVKWP